MKKHPVYIVCFMMILGIVCASLLSLVNYFTAPYIKRNSNSELIEALEKYDIKITKVIENVDKEDKMLAIFEGATKDNSKCYIFEVEEKQSMLKNPYSIYVVISEEDGTIINFFSNETIANPGYETGFLNNNLGVLGSTESNYEANFDAVSGSTLTSNTFKDAFKVAFRQYNQMKGIEQLPEGYKEFTEGLEKVKVALGEKVDNVTLKDKVNAIYTGTLENKDKCYIIEVEESHMMVSNPYKVYVIINATNKTIATFFTVGEFATPGYDENFMNNDLGVIGSDISNYDSNFKEISGASYTSNAFKDAFGIALEQAGDINE